MYDWYGIIVHLMAHWAAHSDSARNDSTTGQIGSFTPQRQRKYFAQLREKKPAARSAFQPSRGESMVVAYSPRTGNSNNRMKSPTRHAQALPWRLATYSIRLLAS